MEPRIKDEHMYGNQAAVLIQIENLKKLVGIGCTVANVGGKLFEGGKLNKGKLLPTLLGLVMDPVFVSFLTVNISQTIPEMKDLSADEIAELKDFAVSTFDIPADALEAKIEQALGIVTQLVIALKALVDFWGKFKG